MNEKLKSTLKYYWSLIVLILLIIALGYNWKYQKNHSENLLKNGLRTEGISFSKGKSLSWEYEIEGIKITKIKSKPFKGVWNSEKFEIAYNPNDFKDISIDYSKFILTEKYSETYSTGLSNKWWNTRNIFFEYKVGNEKYKRIQRLRIKNDIDLNKTYIVRYRNDNPEIGYLILDNFND